MNTQKSKKKIISLSQNNNIHTFENNSNDARPTTRDPDGVNRFMTDSEIRSQRSRQDNVSNEVLERRNRFPGEGTRVGSSQENTEQRRYENDFTDPDFARIMNSQERNNNQQGRPISNAIDLSFLNEENEDSDPRFPGRGTRVGGLLGSNTRPTETSFEYNEFDSDKMFSDDTWGKP